MRIILNNAGLIMRIILKSTTAAWRPSRPANHLPGRHALGNQAGWVNWLLATGTAFYKVLLQSPGLQPDDWQT
jgi:hypothetical protein